MNIIESDARLGLYLYGRVDHLHSDFAIDNF